MRLWGEEKKQRLSASRLNASVAAVVSECLFFFDCQDVGE